MPEGKSLVGWGGPGIGISSDFGQSWLRRYIPYEPTWSVEPGEPIPPQLKLGPPINLPTEPAFQLGESPLANMITVPSIQSAGDLIVNGPPGDYYWCGCMTRMDATGRLFPHSPSWAPGASRESLERGFRATGAGPTRSDDDETELTSAINLGDGSDTSRPGVTRPSGGQEHFFNRLLVLAGCPIHRPCKLV